MRLVLAGLLLAASFSGCLAGDFDAIRQLHAGARGAAPADCRPADTGADAFLGQARANVTHVEVQMGGDSRALPFDDATDVLYESFLLLYNADAGKPGLVSPTFAQDRIERGDHVALSFRASGVPLPNGCGLTSGPRVHFLLDEGRVLACSLNLECRDTGSAYSFDGLREAARTAHEGLGSE